MDTTLTPHIEITRKDRPPVSNIRFKRVLRWSKSERMLRLCRIMWQRGAGSLGIHNPVFQPYDVKLSFAIERKFEDSWIGVYWQRPRKDSASHGTFVYICLVPWFPLRVHYQRGHGGRYS